MRLREICSASLKCSPTIHIEVGFSHRVHISTFITDCTLDHPSPNLAHTPHLSITMSPHTPKKHLARCGDHQHTMIHLTTWTRLTATGAITAGHATADTSSCSSCSSIHCTSCYNQVTATAANPCKQLAEEWIQLTASAKVSIHPGPWLLIIAGESLYAGAS